MNDLQLIQQGGVLKLVGRLTGTTTGVLEQWLAAHTPAPRVWDLSQLEFVSSAGLRVMMVHEKLLRQQGGSTLLVGMSPAVQEVFRITGLAALWPQSAELPPDVIAAPQASSTSEASAPILQTASAVRYRLESTTTSGGTLVRWDGADWRGASVQELGLAFGRGGLGARRELATTRPMVFAAAGRSLSLRLEDGECDVLPIADPAATFLRIEQAWSLTGEPAVTVRLLDEADPAALSDIVRAATGKPWNAMMLLAPATEADAPTRVVLAVLPPEVGALWSGCTLIAPQLATANVWSMPALLERLPDCLAQGAAELLVPAVPERVPSGGWLYVWGADAPLDASTQTLTLEVPAGGLGNGDETELIIRSLYAGCRRVSLTPLTGGFSASTWQVESLDEHGRRLLPTVLKVGTPAMMNREHAAHERYVRPFILNNATVGLGHASQGDAVGLRYNFLGVTGDGADLQTLARRWKSQGAARVQALYETLALRTLQPWYGQAREAMPCLYTDHTPLRLFPALPTLARETLPFDLDSPTLFCAALGRALPNPWWFLANEFPRRATQPIPCKVSITHGDLNLNNVLSDERDNLYVIDFSETRERSVGSDFARLEAILLVEGLELEDDAHEARLLRDLEALYAPDRAWHEVPAVLETLLPERLTFMIQLRQFAASYLGPNAPAEAYLLPLLEWTLPIVMFGNQPLRVRRLSTFIAALQLEKIERLRRS